MTVPVDTLAATVREGFAWNRSIFEKDAAEEALDALVARATQAEADRDMHLRARDSALRTINQLAENSTRVEVEAARLRNDLKIAYEDHEIAEARLREERDALDARNGDCAERVVTLVGERDAAEARCARLQQALEDISAYKAQMRPGPDGLNYVSGDAVWIAREALAGPDTPADSQDCEHGITLENRETGIERCAECGVDVARTNAAAALRAVREGQ